MPKSEALADMLMENRDFLFIQFAIWTSEAVSKEIAVTKSSEPFSLAPSMPAPKGFDCFLARYTELMVKEGRAGAQNHSQTQEQHGDMAWPWNLGEGITRNVWRHNMRSTVLRIYE